MTARVTTLKGPSTGIYYTDGPSYYTRAGEPLGVWHGIGADRLGLRGSVDADAFGRVLSGVDPSGTFVLGRRMGEGSVRGFDVTFSAPKSVSVLWALGDDRLQREVLGAHDAAVAAVMAWVEDHAHTRLRIDGEIVVVDAHGIAAALFRQYTSRAGDPQLHTHAVIANRVLAPDGRWLSLDARTLKLDQRTLSALYHAGLRAELTNRLGVAWHQPVNGIAELRDVPDGLCAEFSLRSLDVADRVAAKHARFVENLGREPTVRERWRLEREAVLDSRPPKPKTTTAAELHAGWQRVARDAGYKPERVIRDVVQSNRTRSRAIDRVSVAASAVAALEDRQSTWRPAEVVRETAAAIPTTTGLSARQVVARVEAIAGYAQRTMVDLSRSMPTDVPLRKDGRPITESALDHILTTPRVLAQELRIDQLAEERLAVASTPNVAALCRAEVELDHAQAELAAAVAGDAELVLAVGPAGTGKTTALRPAIVELTAEGRAVFGVAPSAVAAEVLSTATGMPADTVDKVLVEHRGPKPPAPLYRLPAGGTVVVDEAGMVSTPKLAELFDLAEVQRWRLVLVGDPLQFSAVGRGGMFGYLTERYGAIELGRVQRFTNDWERAASLELRRGNIEILSTYHAHGRIAGGPADEMGRWMVTAWHAARGRGEDALMLAATNDSVAVLNAQAQQLRLARGEIDPAKALTVGAYRFHVGDEVVTRHNDRWLLTDRGVAVHNRDRWSVTALHRDRSMTVAGEKGSVRLPADYVVAHVELGYAQTAHAAQGRTVDRSFLLVDGPADARSVYVPMTRGRIGNHCYVVTAPDQDPLAVLSAAVGREWIDRPALEAATANALLTPAELNARFAEREVVSSEIARVRDEMRANGQRTDAPKQALDRVNNQILAQHHQIRDATRRLAAFDGPWDRVRHHSQRRDARDTIAAGEANLVELRAQRTGAEAQLTATTADVDARHETLSAQGRALRARVGVIDGRLGRDATERGRRIQRDPPNYLEHLLGYQPARGPLVAYWRDAAGDIEQSRIRHGVAEPADTLTKNPEHRSPHERGFVADADHTARNLYRIEQQLERDRLAMQQERGLGISR